MSLDKSNADPGKLQDRQATGNATWPYLAATWFGLGYIRLGPGTIATATALPLYWLLRLAPMPLQVAVVALVTAFSTLCAYLVASDCGQDDPQIVVIDEVTGALVTLLIASSSSIAVQLTALALFRVFDIFKPWPVNVAISGHAGFDIVYDDFVAGVLSGLVVILFTHFVI